MQICIVYALCMYNVRNDQFLRIIGLRHVQGEEQQKLEVVTNDVLEHALAFTGKVCVCVCVCVCVM